MSQETDPRTAQFVETVVFVAVLLAVHLVAFVVARYSMDLLGGSYLSFVCLILPLVSVVASIVLRSLRSWHWGQMAFVIFASLLISFIQLLIIGSASAAV